MCDLCFDTEAKLRGLVCGHSVCEGCEAALDGRTELCIVSDLCDGKRLVLHGEDPAQALERVSTQIVELERLLRSNYRYFVLKTSRAEDYSPRPLSMYYESICENNKRGSDCSS